MCTFKKICDLTKCAALPRNVHVAMLLPGSSSRHCIVLYCTVLDSAVLQTPAPVAVCEPSLPVLCLASMFHHRACASVPSLVTLPAVFLRPLYYSSSSAASAAAFCSFPRSWRRSGQPWREAGGRRRVCASRSSSLPPAGMAEGFKALKLEDDGVPVETVSGNGVSHLQVPFCGSRFTYPFLVVFGS